MVADIQNKISSAFDIFDHEANKTVDVRSVLHTRGRLTCCNNATRGRLTCYNNLSLFKLQITASVSSLRPFKCYVMQGGRVGVG